MTSPANADLAQSAMLDFVVSNSAEAIIVTDPDGIVTSWNAAAHRLTGIASDDALGEPLASQLELSVSDLMEQLLTRAIGGEVIEEQRTLIRHGRQSTAASLTLAPLHDDRSSLIGVVAMARDIAEIVETQEVLAEVQTRMTQTQRLARIGLWAWDCESDEVQWSEQLYDLARVSPRDFDGDLAAHLAVVSEDFRPMVEAAMRGAIVTASSFDVEFELVCADGERRWVHQTGDPIVGAGDRVTELRGICQDLTDRHRAIEALRRADEVKDEFLGTVSHELRTPLTSIVGFGDLLRESVDDELRQYVEIIVRNGREMHDMVERILDFSRVRSGRLVLTAEPCAIDDLVDDAWPLVVSSVSAHVVDRSIADDAIAIVDPSAFSRILVNLVSNAAKFSPEGSRISICARRDGSCCRVEVSDEGPGIPTDELELVFDRFHQVPSTIIAEKRGAGIGLSIVRSYTELLGGRVWAESHGSGTTVVVELPT